MVSRVRTESLLWEQVAVIKEYSIGNVDDHGSGEIAQAPTRVFLNGERWMVFLQGACGCRLDFLVTSSDNFGFHRTELPSQTILSTLRCLVVFLK
ncbi:hypothetical protein WR25_12745 [Diploscapter pachys]|uniref:Uncharacterized protein n=1 Tax=Diploscapter pachys TaxID=2018661 RepID=A0A2A2JVE3_9BILA|nr:hypothetical protein WR25_12745 [Diploscapter pachys]